MTEGCEYRDLFEQFQALGVDIIGTSFDKPAENKSFSFVNNFQYPLFSDADRELALHFGAASSANQFWADRITVVLDPDGRWILRYEDVFNTKEHPNEVLADMQKILGE
ncbi:MAG: peroxiredoxin Q/BCP [Myxococcota bacterium]|jgi:peroxiredoxin Q/BCP